MRRFTTVAVLLALAGLGGGAAPAMAGPPGTWSRVTGMGGGVQARDEIGLERTGNSVLHVAWTRTGSAGNQLLHSAISADARRVSGPNLIIAPSEGLNDRVDLTAGPGGGLRVFFAGLLPAPFNGRMGTATAGPDGRSWSVQRSPASNGTPGTASPVYPASGISGLVAGGTPISMWGDSAPGAGGYHVGVDPSTPDFHFQSTCCATDPNAARETGTGRVVYGWNRQSLTGTSAVVQSPGGPVQTVPNSAATQIGQRLGITGRIGHRGVYVAYTAGENRFLGVPALWRVGEPQPQILSRVRGARYTTAAPTPGGQLWVMWAREGRIYAGRTSFRGTRVGRVLTVTPPRGTQVIRNLTGEASRGPLDLFALVDRGSRGSGYFHQRLLPPLAVQVNPARVASRGGRIVVHVTDSGRNIAGAVVSVRVGSRTLRARTGAGGRATIALGSAPRGTYVVRAVERGYSEGLDRFHVG